MALYVDSAVLDEVGPLCAEYPIAGITTNPSILLAAAERGQRLAPDALLTRLLALCAGPVFFQPAGETADALRAAAARAVALDPARIVAKLPLAPEGIAAGLALRREGARIAFTAVATPQQAYLGALAGAEWVIPYFGRLRRAGIDPCQQLTQMARVVHSTQASVRILAASIRAPGDLAEALLAGAQDVTAPPELIRSLASDPLSQAAVAQFAADARRLTTDLPPQP